MIPPSRDIVIDLTTRQHRVAAFSFSPFRHTLGARRESTSQSNSIGPAFKDTGR